MNVKIIGIGAIIVAVMLIAAIFVGLVPLELGRVTINPETSHNWQLDGMTVGNYDGTDMDSYELITNPVGGIAGKRNAFILGKTAYSESEFITAQAYCWKASTLWGFVGRGVSDYGWYVIKHKASTSAEWVVIADEDGNKVQWLNYANQGKQLWLERTLDFWGTQYWQTLEKALSFSIIGGHPGAIRIEVHTEIKWDFFDNWHEVTIAADEAELLSSGGTVKRVDEEATYEEGDSFEVRIETDYSGRTVGQQEFGYVVKLIDPDGNEVFQKDVTDNYDGTITINVESGWYKPDWSNRFRISLQNQFRNIGEVSFGVVDFIGLVPADCSISTNIPENGKIQAKENVVVDFTAGEKIGAVPIISFRWCAFYGASGTNEPPAGSADWIQDWTYVTAEESLSEYHARVQFEAPENDGYVTLLGWTNGEGNRLSEIITPYGFYVYTDVEPEDEQLDPGSLGEGDAYQGGYRGLTNWFEPILEPENFSPLGIIIAIIVAIIVAILAFLYNPMPIQFRVGIAAILAIIVAVVIYYFSYFYGGN